MDSLGSTIPLMRGCGDSTQREQRGCNKTATLIPCHTPSTTSRVYPVRLANDLLKGAYSIRGSKSWKGERDLAEETWSLHQLRLKAANTAKEWQDAADRLDMLEGNHNWKFLEDSDECDMELIRKRLNRLKKVNHEGDIEQMLSEIRSALKRDLGGMCNPGLYRHTYVGTKHLIEEYTEIVKYTVERIVKYCESADEETVGKFLNTIKETRRCFGNSALMLSGGGTLGMCHIGVVKTLLEEGLLPRIVCGSSAGSIVGAVLCTNKSDTIVAKLEELCSGDLQVFQGSKERQGIPGMAVNILKGDPAFDVTNLCRVMKTLLGNITFREAYNYSGMVLNIHVSCRDKYNLPRLLNYITSPNVMIWTAVASSCSLPWVFEAPGLKSKDPNTGAISSWGHDDHKWVDGSIEGDLPAQIMERLFNVNNFIACQVNPHVSAFLPVEGEPPGWFRKSSSVLSANIIYLLDGLMTLGYDEFPVKMAHSVLSQKYDGDITILPDIKWVPWHSILANPNHAFMNRARRHGEQATWPKLDRIRNMVAIELALVDGIKHLQTMKVGNDHSHSRRAISSTRSEYGGMPRRKSGGPGDLNVIPRITRGRQTAHRPVKSMIEPDTLSPAVLGISKPHADNILSSSDETRSGRSSPVTSYDDEDFDDLADGPLASGRMTPDEAQRRLMAFLSQPASPSISFKTFWGKDSHAGREQAAIPPTPTPAPPQTPSSPEVRRALNHLHMSSIDSKVDSPSPRRKRKGDER